MASSSSASLLAPPTWQPDPRLPPSQAEALRAAVASLPPSHLLPPTHGEEFLSGEEAELRLHNYAFAHGYCLVNLTGSLKALRLRLACKHHGDKTQNKRGTTEEERSAIDEQGRQLRRPNTKVAFTGCRYRLYVVLKPVDGGGGRKAWQTGVTCGEHSGHLPLPNPFAYPKHQKRYPHWYKTVEVALTLRSTTVPFKKVNEVLTSANLPQITAQQYRNLQRSDGSAPLTPQQRFQNLFQCLHAEDFRIKELDVWRIDPFTGDKVEKVLEQLVFASTLQVDLARRFVSGFVLIIDATFSTNDKNLLLSICTGVTNTGKTFPICFSFQTSEARSTFDLIWEFLEENVFYDIDGPAVILGDQAAGFTFSMEGRTEIMQLCQWHAVENIKTRLIKHGYYKTKENREFFNGLLWEYVKSATIEDLAKNRSDFLYYLEPSEQDYMVSWRRKEESFVTCFIKWYPNLSTYSTQRGESFHRIVKDSLHPAISLPEACKRITNSIKSVLEDAYKAENDSRRGQGRVLDRSAFRLMIGQVTHRAIELMSIELALLMAMRSNEEDKEAFTTLASADPPVCQFNCTLPIQFGLLCRCWMASGINQGLAIPLSLIHPRWLIDGGPRLAIDWAMGYETALPIEQTGVEARDQYKNHGRNLMLNTSFQTHQYQQGLTGEQADRFAYLHKLQSAALVEQFQKQPTVTTVLPNRIESSRVAFKTHGKTTHRGMTGREQADQSQRAKERDDLTGLTDEQKKARRNKKAREARAAKKMKEQGLKAVDEEILTASYIERVETIASTAPARIESSKASRKRSVSMVSISSDSFEDPALLYPSDSSTGEPGPAPSSPPRSGQQPFIMSQQSVEEDDFPIDEDDDALLALAEAQATLAREAEAEADVGKGKGRKVEAADTVEIEAAAEEAAVIRRPQRQRKNVRLYGDSQTWDKYVERGDI